MASKKTKTNHPAELDGQPAGAATSVPEASGTSTPGGPQPSERHRHASRQKAGKD